MDRFSEKVHLRLNMPTEDVPVSDQTQIILALNALGYSPISMPLSVIRKLYPMCRDSGFDITLSLVHRDMDWFVTDVEPGDQTLYHYGLAVDYGSTTIVMRLLDMNSGTVIGEEKTFNGQSRFGNDILTRITYYMEDQAHAEELHKATIDSFHTLMDQLTETTGIDVRRCPLMILSGNTTMIHFIMKLNPWTVFASPYAPVVSNPGFLSGSELEMDFGGMIYIIPAASNYVGGDIISGLLKLDIHKSDEIGMFFDIGTNGELVIGNREWMVAGSGAAGPALEGYVSKFGTRAVPGAIDSVQIHGDLLTYTTIGNQKPIGICGSGIIDLLAQMRLNGWINIAGELDSNASHRIVWLDKEQEYGAIYATGSESASGQPLYFSQTDIMQYLDTKAAAFTMIECLMESAGVTEQDINKAYLSGAFPAHSDLESAITIGIFPDLPRDKYEVISNSSLEGAQILLLDRSRLQEVQELAGTIYCVQFASIPDFLVRMQAAKFIPHTDLDRFPSVSLPRK